MTKKKYYRFSDGSFIKASTFDEAKSKKIKAIEAEIEKESAWHACTCVGLSHRYGCPEHVECY